MTFPVLSGASRSRKIGLAASFSALYGLFRVAPTFPIVGLSGAYFPLSDVLPPVYGLLLGPELGFIVVFTGTLLALLLGKPPIFLGLDFIPASMNTVVVGLAAEGMFLRATLLYAVVLAVFIIHPASSKVVEVPLSSLTIPIPFHWMHLLTMLIATPPVSKRLARWLNPVGESPKSFLSLFSLSLLGTLCQHSSGSVLWETIYGYVLNALTPEEFKAIWATVFWLYPAERILLALTSTVLGISILKILTKLPGNVSNPPPR